MLVRDYRVFLAAFLVAHLLFYLDLLLPVPSLVNNKSDASCLGQTGAAGGGGNIHSYAEFKEDHSTVNSTFEYKRKVVYHAKFGLGHRFSKMGSVWHFTKSINLTRLEFHWLDCTSPESYNLFSRLFGKPYIDVPWKADAMPENVETNSNNGEIEPKSIHVTNDVLGYYGGFNYKIHQVPLSAELYKGNKSPWLLKQDSDVELYKILRQRFVGKEKVIKFMGEHKFQDHFVIGLHLRFGNGEGSHFARAGRKVSNEMQYVENLLDLLRLFLERLQQSHQERFIGCKMKKKKPMIFLATDSPRYIPLIEDATSLWGVKTVVMSQIRVGKGVTFAVLHNGQECYQGWHDMLLDNIILSFSDVLVAPRYSTFTQTLPAQLIFDRNMLDGVRGPSFCECSESAQTMLCVEDIRTWIFRDDENKMFRYSTLQKNETVPHQLSIEFPDKNVSHLFDEVKYFLKGEYLSGRTIMRYGDKRGFNSKFRNKAVCPDCTEFAFEEEYIE